MRPLLTVCVVAAVATVGVLVLAACRTEHRPPAGQEAPADLRFDSAEYVAPPLLASEVSNGWTFVEHVFRLVNDSPQSRTVRYTGADCGCAGVRFEDSPDPLKSHDSWVLDPGASRAICMRIALRPRSMSSSVTARFASEDAVGRETTASCKLAVSVVDDLSLSPSQVIHALATPEGRAATTIHVVTATRTAAPKSVAVDNLPREVTLIGVLPEGSGPIERHGIYYCDWAIRLAIHWDRGTAGDGSALVARLVVPLGKGRWAEAGLPVILRRTTGLDAPTAVHFGTVPPGTTRTRRLLIRARDEKPFKITELTLPSWATAEYGPFQTGLNWWVDLHVSPKNFGAYDDTVRIHTDNGASPALSVRTIVVCDKPTDEPRPGSP